MRGRRKRGEEKTSRVGRQPDFEEKTALHVALAFFGAHPPPVKRTRGEKGTAQQKQQPQRSEQQKARKEAASEKVRELVSEGAPASSAGQHERVKKETVSTETVSTKETEHKQTVAQASPALSSRQIYSPRRWQRLRQCVGGRGEEETEGEKKKGRNIERTGTWKSMYL